MFIRTQPGDQLWERLRFIIAETFKAGLVTYLAFYVIEFLRPGFVSYFLNLDVLLWIVISTGVVTMATAASDRDAEQQPVRPLRHLLYSTGAGVVAACIIYFQIRELGSFAWIISVLSGIIITLMSIYLISITNEDT